jgi:hypothetical protein
MILTKLKEEGSQEKNDVGRGAVGVEGLVPENQRTHEWSELPMYESEGVT